jgi:hypothetical protein
MFLFGFILFVSVGALLGVRAMDVECVNEPKVRPYRAVRTEQRSGFPSDSMGLRQI